MTQSEQLANLHPLRLHIQKASRLLENDAVSPRQIKQWYQKFLEKNEMHYSLDDCKGSMSWNLWISDW